jgi:hypothetical protein
MLLLFMSIGSSLKYFSLILKSRQRSFFFNHAEELHVKEESHKGTVRHASKGRRSKLGKLQRKQKKSRRLRRPAQATSLATHTA